jgi:glutathione S-transferase
MTQLSLYGPPQSSYVRAARITCLEKGVSHRLESIELGSAEHERLHPWRRVPAMRHGDVALYETSAIIRYVDEAFDGPRLTPTTPAARGVMEQWISALNCYVYRSWIKNYALEYIIPKFRGGTPNREAIEGGLAAMDRDVARLDEGYGARPWLAGDTMSLADLLVAPMVQTISMFPEGSAALAKRKNLSRAYEALRSRESFKTVHLDLFR